MYSLWPQHEAGQGIETPVHKTCVGLRGGTCIFQTFMVYPVDINV